MCNGVQIRVCNTRTLEGVQKGVCSKRAEFVLKRVEFVLKRVEFVLKRAQFVLKRAQFVLKRGCILQSKRFIGYNDISCTSGHFGQHILIIRKTLCKENYRR